MKIKISILKIFINVFEIISAHQKRAANLLSAAHKRKGISLSKWKNIISQAINEIVGQSWTVFGLLVGWVVLPEGDTRNFVGATLGVLTIVWLLTMPLRISSEE